jgi:hypothetical protein
MTVESAFSSLKEQNDFLFFMVSRLSLEFTQPPFQWIPQAIYLGLKESGNEAEHSPPSGAEIKNV